MTICLAMLAVLTVDAQKKPKVSKAKSLWQSGNYIEAKEILDAAIEFEKIKDDGETWYYRGLLYASIDTTSNEEYKALSENALEVALASFQKAEELSDGKGYAVVTTTSIATLDQQLAGYYGYYYTKAVTSYDNDDLEEASRNFETASQIMPQDTTSVVNAAYMSLQGDDPVRALELFDKAIERGSVAKSTFSNVAGIYLKNEDQENALKALRKALEKHPSAVEFKRQEISILINMGKAEEAKVELVSAIESEPEDPGLRFALGLLHEELNDKQEALKAYQSALDIDPNHYASAFNKAVIIFNEANELYKEKAALGISKADIAKAKSLDPKIKEGFTKALPAWEQVYSIQTPERPTLETMLFLYAYLGEEKKADKIEAELDALGDDDEE